MQTPPTQPKQFTGRHMLFAMLAFFGVIIIVNLTMAAFATRSWTCLLYTSDAADDRPRV